MGDLVEVDEVEGELGAVDHAEPLVGRVRLVS